MDKDEIKGKVDKAKGYVKDKAGEVMNDPDLEAEGEAERATGAVREGYGTVKRKVGDTVEEIKDTATDDRSKRP